MSKDRLGVSWGYAGGIALPSVSAAREAAVFAESAGFDSLWISQAAAVDPIVALITNAVSENPGVEHPFVLNRLLNRGTDYFASDRAIANRDRAESGVRGDILIYTDGTAFTVVADNVTFE